MSRSGLVGKLMTAGRLLTVFDSKCGNMLAVMTQDYYSTGGDTIQSFRCIALADKRLVEMQQSQAVSCLHLASPSSQHAVLRPYEVKWHDVRFILDQKLNAQVSDV